MNTKMRDEKAGNGGKGQPDSNPSGDNYQGLPTPRTMTGNPTSEAGAPRNWVPVKGGTTSSARIPNPHAYPVKTGHSAVGEGGSEVPRRHQKSHGGADDTNQGPL